jgi:hypothetical protein
LIFVVEKLRVFVITSCITQFMSMATGAEKRRMMKKTGARPAMQKKTGP